MSFGHWNVSSVLGVSNLFVVLLTAYRSDCNAGTIITYVLGQVYDSLNAENAKLHIEIASEHCREFWWARDYPGIDNCSRDWRFFWCAESPWSSFTSNVGSSWAKIDILLSFIIVGHVDEVFREVFRPNFVNHANRGEVEMAKSIVHIAVEMNLTQDRFFLIRNFSWCKCIGESWTKCFCKIIWKWNN